MKRILSVLRGHEKGQVMILSLILLVVGGLVITPLLSYMGSGLKVGQTYEKQMDKLYAADSGVEDAIWNLQDYERLKGLIQEFDPDYVPPSGWDNWTPADYDWPLLYELTGEINSKDVGVTIDYVDDKTYKITSTGSEGDSSTTVEAFITTRFGDYSGILQHVITSQDSYDVHKNVTINPPDPNHENGPVEYYSGPWPTPEELAAYYGLDVINESPYSSDTLDVKDYVATGIGPLYRDGTLSIVNTGAGLGELQSVLLKDTLYITGDTLIGTTDHEFWLDLNGNTIFVESDTVGQHNFALEIGGKCTLTGSGCIIAVGNIKFQPNLQCGEDDYVLVMTLIGETLMWPSGNFYGTLAGGLSVEVDSGQTPLIQWNPLPVGGVNFPGGGNENIIWGIATWEIS